MTSPTRPPLFVLCATLAAAAFAQPVRAQVAHEQLHTQPSQEQWLDATDTNLPKQLQPSVTGSAPINPTSPLPQSPTPIQLLWSKTQTVTPLAPTTAKPGSAFVREQEVSLFELYESARATDAAFQSARAQFEATLYKAEQSLAGVLPTAGASMGLSRNLFDNIAPSTSSFNREYSTHTMGVSISQPLYRPANIAALEQGKKQPDLATSQLQAAAQDLMMRVTQAYFDVLAAQDSLDVVKAQKKAVAEQLAAAKRNFEVGTSTITDTREAQAKADLVVAQELAADNDLLVKKMLLAQIAGLPSVAPKRLTSMTPTLPTPQGASANDWVNRAMKDHPGIKQAEIAIDIAKLETEKAKAGHLPTLDLVANYGVNRSFGGTATSAYGGYGRYDTGSIGLTLTIPLFAGFSTENRIKETVALTDKAQNDLNTVKNTVSQSTRSAYFGVMSGLGQVKAYEAAVKSSQSALDANLLGYQVGVRINIDVLNAQTQLYQTQRDLAKARYDVIVGNIKLKQANGSLVESDLKSVNSLLVK